MNRRLSWHRAALAVAVIWASSWPAGGNEPPTTREAGPASRAGALRVICPAVTPGIWLAEDDIIIPGRWPVFSPPGPVQLVVVGRATRVESPSRKDMVEIAVERTIYGHVDSPKVKSLSWGYPRSHQPEGTRLIFSLEVADRDGKQRNRYHQIGYF